MCGGLRQRAVACCDGVCAVCSELRHVAAAGGDVQWQTAVGRGPWCAVTGCVRCAVSYGMWHVAAAGGDVRRQVCSGPWRVAGVRWACSGCDIQRMAGCGICGRTKKG